LQEAGLSPYAASLIDNSLSIAGSMGGINTIHATGLMTSPRFYLPKEDQIFFGQQTVSAFFSEAGNFKLRPISEVVQELRNGTISPNALPLEIIVRDCQTITLNNRSLLALRRANLKPKITIDRTGVAKYEELLDYHLQGSLPSDVIRVRGGPPGTSLINPPPK